MKKLNVSQMENLQGGKMTWGCAGAILGTVLAIEGLATATGRNKKALPYGRAECVKVVKQ